MKASKLIKMIQQRIDTLGDKDVMIDVQTGPDSFENMPVKGVEPYRVGQRGGKIQFFIET